MLTAKTFDSTCGFSSLLSLDSKKSNKGGSKLLNGLAALVSQHTIIWFIKYCESIILFSILKNWVSTTNMGKKC